MMATHTILVVDDDLDTLKLVGTTLEKQGFTIIVAKDGQEALEKAVEHKPDLLLLDVMMPKMDGYEVTRRLRTDPQTAGIPIILFTAKAQVDDKVTGLEAGADDYLTKPTHPAELVARVRSILKRPASMAASSTQPTPASQGTTARCVVGVIAAKGGQGASTLATNLAVGFRQRYGAAVVLAELTPGHGDLNVRLGKSGQGLADLLRRSARDIYRSAVEQALTEHKSGIQLLLAGTRPSDITLAAAGEQMSALMAELKQMAAYVVLDMGSSLTTSAQRALEHCTQVVVLAEPDPNSVEQTKALLAELNSLGVADEKIFMAMLHRVRTELAVNAAGLQQLLGRELDAVFTPAPELAHQATRTRQSMLESDPQSYTAQQTMKLVELIAGTKSRDD